MKALPKIAVVAVTCLVASSLSGCGGAVMMGLSAAGAAMTLAKDGLDLDVSVHSLLNQNKPAAPIPPAALITNPEYAVVTPPPGVAGQPVPLAPPPAYSAPAYEAPKGPIPLQRW